MKTKSEQNKSQPRNREHGNALVYVLIAIVLFAGLSFTLSRQSDTGEVGSLDEERAGLIATQIIGYASDVKSAYEKMEFTGTILANLDVIPPSDADFNTAPHINKIYHPDGGGLNVARLPNNATDDSNITTPGDPAPGWYLGFNDIEWTAVTPDLVLTAYGLSQQLCGLLNEKITGSTAIPTVGDSLKETLIQKNVDGVDFYTTGTNVVLTTDGGDLCPDCDTHASLCVQEGGVFAFYTSVAER